MRLVAVATVAALVIASLLGCGEGTEAAPNYHSQIARDWHPIAVRSGQATLSSAGDEAQCLVKAYGWRLFGVDRVESGEDRGRDQQRWGWKMLVENAGQQPFRIAVLIELVTDKNYSISGDCFGLPVGGLVSGSKWTDDGNWVEAGETRLLRGSSWYWVDSHVESGRPDHVTWSLRLYRDDE